MKARSPAHHVCATQLSHFPTFISTITYRPHSKLSASKVAKICTCCWTVRDTRGDIRRRRALKHSPHNPTTAAASMGLCGWRQLRHCDDLDPKVRASSSRLQQPPYTLHLEPLPLLYLDITHNCAAYRKGPRSLGSPHHACATCQRCVRALFSTNACLCCVASFLPQHISLSPLHVLNVRQPACRIRPALCFTQLSASQPSNPAAPP